MHFPGWKLSIFKIKNYVGFQKQAYFAFQRYKALKNNNEITSLELLISANHLPLSGQFFVSLEVQSIWVWNRYVKSRLKDPPHPHPYFCLATPPPIGCQLTVSVLCFWKIVTCLLSEKCMDSTRSFCDVKNEFSMTVLLVQNIKECALFKWHVFLCFYEVVMQKIRKRNETTGRSRWKNAICCRWQNEVVFNRDWVEGLDDNLKRLSDALAELFWETLSLEERLQLFNR